MYLGIGVERERDKVNVVDVSAGGIWVKPVQEFINASLKLRQDKKLTEEKERLPFSKTKCFCR